ncbi:myo-inositol-1(or 4)-monophosphatase [Aminobacter niigataensis]|uniref:Myo-inositol-1(Or 4)-monophosphatase n=1 Tax=Aminobacter niigataensis TaxID=83265 RepID=A0ABR6L0X0_9HYPH|nr:inositol monophosphatase [Aminobacter niigataensis]MBB4650434.1 myo-inositol-1(or 4)-monophosphatase [Aminobacter niigataensis]
MIEIDESRRLRAVAEQASQLMREPLLAAFRSNMAVDYKVDLHDVVTRHDKEAEVAIRAFILGEVPDSVVVGEEAGESGVGRVRWYVDPIDGTSNFARGFAFWCVSVGVAIDGEIVAGAVYDPVAGMLFSADLSGAWLNGEPLQSRAIADERHATLITGYPVARDLRLDGREQALANFGVLAETFSTLRRPGSGALSLCHVAAGWVDASAGFGSNPWDVAAAVLILKQAGGSYHPLTLGKVGAGVPDFMCPGYVALGDGADYPTLMRVAREISDGREAAKAARPKLSMAGSVA